MSTDDEREALRRVIEPMLRGWMDESGYSEDVIVGLADDISGEVLEANLRRQGPITDSDGNYQGEVGE